MSNVPQPPFKPPRGAHSAAGVGRKAPPRRRNARPPRSCRPHRRCGHRRHGCLSGDTQRRPGGRHRGDRNPSPDTTEPRHHRGAADDCRAHDHNDPCPQHGSLSPADDDGDRDACPATRSTSAIRCTSTTGRLDRFDGFDHRSRHDHRRHRQCVTRSPRTHSGESPQTLLQEYIDTFSGDFDAVGLAPSRYFAVAGTIPTTERNVHYPTWNSSGDSNLLDGLCTSNEATV